MIRRIYSLLTIALVIFPRICDAASPFAGFYVGQIYTSISGNVSLPERPIGGVALTINADGLINSSGDLSGTVSDSGAITWNANSTGFTTGKIENGVVSSRTLIDNNGTISNFRIEARNSGPGIGEGNALAGRLAQKNPIRAMRDMNRIRFLGDKFVAVGRSGAFGTSLDGVNWTRIGVPTTLDLYDVAYGNGHYVVVGDSSARFWSTNGVDWVANPAAPGPAAAVAFGNGKFVSMHFNGVVSVSTDGVGWGSGTAFSGSGYAGLDFVNGEFVAWNGSKVAFSADAGSWTAKTGETGLGNITVSLGIHSKIAYGNGMYVMAGGQGLATSPNGTTWTKATNAPDVFFGNSASVTFGNGIFVVCDTADRLWTSSNATQWTPVDQVELFSMAYGNGLFVGVGSQLWTSADGSLWTFPQDDVLQPDYHESGYVDPDSEGPIVGTFAEGPTGTYSFGRNGYITWFQYEGAGGSGTAPQLTSETLRFAMNLNYFEPPVMVGNHGAMVVADDRSTVTFKWVPPVTSADLVHGAKGNGTLVFVGTQGAIIWTSNPARTNWSVASSGTSANLKHAGWYDNFVTGLPTQFIAVGEAGTLLTSGNGQNWTARDSKIKTDLVGSAYSRERKQFLVAAADGTLLQSADGVTWTATTPLPAPRTLRYFKNTDPTLKSFAIEGGGDDGLFITETPGNFGRFTMGSPRAFSFPGLNAAALGNGRFLAIGSSSATSPDAQNWTVRSNDFTAVGVAFGAGKFVAIGANHEFGVSGDGLHWALRMNLPTRSFRGITSGGGKFVAVGSNGAIGISDDGVNWADKSIASSVSYNDIAWNAGTFMAGGTSGTVLISTNGGNSWIEKPTFLQEIKGITFGHGQWVVVALNGSSAISADGLRWESKKYPFISPVENSPNFSRIAFADGSFYATSSRGEIFISTDGLNWQRNFTGLGADLRGAVVGNGGILFIDNNEIHLLNVPDAGSPVITQRPVSTTINEDATLTLTAAALGNDLEFSWLKDGVPITSGARISGADSTRLIVAPALLEDAGRYQFAVANKFGSRVSASAIISLNPKALIATQPKSTVEAIGNAVTLAVEATGQNLAYQWFKNAAPIPGATAAKLDIARLSASDAADYYVEITNAVGVRQSEHAALSAVSLASGYAVDPHYPSTADISPLALSAMAYQQDGKLVLAGTIGVKGAYKPLVRLNGDGTLDTSFSADTVNNQIRALQVLADGKILIGGLFTQVGTVSKINIARLSPDGKVDAAYTSPITQNAGVYVFKARPDGKILVGGSFGQFGGTTAVRYLGLLNADGTAATFSPPLLKDYILAIQPNIDGSLLLGGGSISSRGLVTRLLPNNTLDVTFPAGGSGPSAFGGGFGPPNVQAILPAPNGQFYVGGYFNYYNGQPRIDLVRIQPNGDLDTTFVPGLTAESIGSVRTMAFLGDNLLIGGDLNSYAGSTNDQNLILIDRTGAVVSAPKLPKFLGTILEVKVLDDDSILVRGDFQIVDGQTNKCLVHLVAGGGSDTSLGIVRQPQSVTLKQGYPATLAVAATGRGTLTFQWRKDGQDLPGKTEPTLTIAAAAPEHAGKYSVAVKDSSGSLTSQDAVLSFDQQPSGGGFAAWAATYALPAGHDGLLQDADGDGFSNAAEFAFGTNPAQAGSKPQLDQKAVSVNGQSFPAVQYLRNKNATGVTIQIRVSNSVTFDSAAGVVELTPAEDLGNGLERVTVRSATAAPHTFFFEVKTAGN